MSRSIESGPEFGGTSGEDAVETFVEVYSAGSDSVDEIKAAILTKLEDEELTMEQARQIASILGLDN